MRLCWAGTPGNAGEIKAQTESQSMKLAYFRDPAGNFGDDLNPWLWDRLLPGVMDEDDSSVFLGMGTILEPWFVEALKPGVAKHVLGAGSGMSVPPLQLGPEWHVHAVRGPLTASYLQIDPGRAMTDPAMAVAKLWNRSSAQRRGVGFMPHHTSLRTWNWQKTCHDAGLAYVDPHGEPVATLEQIDGMELLITEAMHGAIVAEALRIPWLPVQINPHNYVGKWHDWGAGLAMPIHFRPLPFLNDPAIGGRSSLFEAGTRMAVYRWRRRSSGREHRDAIARLQSYARGDYQTFLGSDAALDGALQHLERRVEAFKADWRAGRLD